MRKKIKKIFAAFLMCLLFICEIPMQAFAGQIPENITAGEEETGKTEDRDADSEDAEGLWDGNYYKREFANSGLKVDLHAKEGVIPENAEVSVTPFDSGSLEYIKEEIQKKMEDFTRQKRSSDCTGMRTIFDMYYDLQASVEQIYAFDFEITYLDEEGNSCVFEPEGEQNIEVSMEIDGLGDVVSDEMQEAALFYVPDAYAAGNDRQSRKAGEIELLTDNININGDKITFKAGHFSIYTVAVIKYAALITDGMEVAQEKAWKIINTYADPEYFLDDPLRKEMTDAQYKELHKAALDATAGCTTPYDKIKAIIAFVAGRTYYDYKYLEDEKKNPTYFNPYDVYMKKRTVCSGFARFQRTLLTSIGIPCMNLSGKDHEYNAAYDSVNKKWIFSDATWCCGNNYTKDGEWIEGQFSYRNFDLEPRQIAGMKNHEIYFIDGLLDKTKNSAYYRLETKYISDENYSKIVWCDCDWHLCVSGAKEDAVKAVSGFAGFKVLEIQNHAFREGGVKSIDLSATGILDIGYAAFYKCKKLKSVKFPANLKNMGEYAFQDCSNIRNIDLSKTNITKINKCLFSGCKKLEKIKFPKKLKKIGEYAFSGCGKLKEINLYETKTTQIGYKAFYDCKSASAIKLPSTLKAVEAFAFGCKVKRPIKTTAITALSAKKIGLKDKNNAVWGGRKVTIRAYSFKIKFIANHKSAKGKMKTISCTYGKKKKLSANQFKVKGYKFVGWNMKKNGKGKSYKNQEKVKNLTSKAGGTVKLYAQWKKQK